MSLSSQTESITSWAQRSTFTGSLAAHEAYLGDFSYIIGNYSQDITVVRSEHSGLATNSIDYLGACVFDSKPVAGFGAFVHLAKATA